MKKIIHVDADCFFVAVELRQRPELKNLPVAVGGSPTGRGVIATCNYVARSYGVRSAMSSIHALRLCPDLIFLSPNMAIYREVSAALYRIYSDYSDLIQTVSLDEAYLDVSNTSIFSGSGTLIAREIQQRALRELSIPVSIGVASVKYLAKIASDWNKPFGILTISPECMPEFVPRLALKLLPGVGPKTWQKLSRLGLYTCSDILLAEHVFLEEHFGTYATSLIGMSKGEDAREIIPSRERKSVSVEHTFPSDIGNVTSLAMQLPSLLDQLEARLDGKVGLNRLAKRVLKLKFSDFRSTSIESSIASSEQAFDLSQFERLIHVAYRRSEYPVRLLGVGFRLSGSDIPQQLMLSGF